MFSAMLAKTEADAKVKAAAAAEAAKAAAVAKAEEIAAAKRVRELAAKQKQLDAIEKMKHKAESAIATMMGEDFHKSNICLTSGPTKLAKLKHI
jgi:regulatory protein YycH of two-component signal transduction system YycFG